MESDLMKLHLPRYSIGVGDRFGHQAAAQLHACQLAHERGAAVAPVWNKSFREHTIVGSKPSDTRGPVERAIKAAGWTWPYFLDADHINLKNVETFLPVCDFFTIDVASAIGSECPAGAIDEFLARHPELSGRLELEGAIGPIELTESKVRAAAAKYLMAVRQAGVIYRHIEAAKGAGSFVPEVSMDETEEPQGPAELLVILAAAGDEQLPLQTIAPKFTGRFNKGVDYAGDVEGFDREFRNDLAVLKHSAARYGLPSNIKLSVHSGSDKFSIYPLIRRAMQDTGAGVHLKTAGTNWLEELIGLAESGGEALALVKDIYAIAYSRREELCAPYADVVDILPERLPAPQTVLAWDSGEYAAALRHDRSCPAYNADLRQLLHVAFKVAAEKGRQYLDLLESCEPIIAKNVTENLYRRHLIPLLME
jgi:tagaturonate epimerase